MAVLTDKELREAVKEWCERRGLPFGNLTLSDIDFDTLHRRGAQTTGATSTNYDFVARIRGLEMEVKEPYR